MTQSLSIILVKLPLALYIWQTVMEIIAEERAMKAQITSTHAAPASPPPPLAVPMSRTWLHGASEFRGSSFGGVIDPKPTYVVVRCNV